MVTDNKKETPTTCPKNQAEWRRWLMKHHQTESSVWLIYYKKTAPLHNLTWSEAVDEALCFGWIDSVRKTLDDERFIQFFSKRKPRSGWSKINKEKIKRLTEEGKMTTAGDDCIQKAKENGSWALLDTVEELTIPNDLLTAFKAYPGAKKYFSGLTRSAQKMMLHWVVTAKRAETRAKRINEIAMLAGRQQKPKQFS
jgi:uncharacterized protein YdeI (YjbR/CyaY-like superfamily)